MFKIEMVTLSEVHLKKGENLFLVRHATRDNIIKLYVEDDTKILQKEFFERLGEVMGEDVKDYTKVNSIQEAEKIMFLMNFMFFVRTHY